MNQQPNAFDGLPIDRLVKDIVEFKEKHPLPFRDTDNGEGTEGWVSVLSLCFSFSVCFQLSGEDLVSNYILYTDIF